MLKLILCRKVITGHIDIFPWFNFDPNYKPTDRDYYVLKNVQAETVVMVDGKMYTSRDQESLLELNKFLRRSKIPVKAWPLI